MNEPFERAPEAVIEEIRRVLHDAGVAPEHTTLRKVRALADVIYMAGQQRERERLPALLASNEQSDDAGTTTTEGCHAVVLAHIEARMESGELVRHNADITFQRDGPWTREVEIEALTDLAAGIAWKIERLFAERDEAQRRGGEVV